MADTREDLVRLLNRAMSMEYGGLFLLPNYIAQVQDEELKRELRLIVDVELEHAEKTAQLIYALGGTPNADLPQVRPRSGAREIVEAQIEAEKAAVEIYTRGAAFAPEANVREVLGEIGREEEGHLALLQRSLARLDAK